MTAPSVWIFYNVYSEYITEDRIKQFVEYAIGEDEIFLDSYTLKPQADGSKTLYLKVYGQAINESKIPMYQKTLDSLKAKNVNVAIIPTSEIPLQKVKQLETELSEVGDRLNLQIDQLKEERDVQQKLVESMINDPDYLINDSMSFVTASEELKIFLPEIEEIGLAKVQFTDFLESNDKIPTAVVRWNRPSKGAEEKLETYLRKQFNLDTIRIMIVE